IVSSVSPSLKYSCSGFADRFSNGSTASITRFRGTVPGAGDELESLATGVTAPVKRYPRPLTVCMKMGRRGSSLSARRSLKPAVLMLVQNQEKLHPPRVSQHFLLA